ncbi:hypothetical protein ACHAWF_005874 [Thalassiosira exigua]
MFIKKDIRKIPQILADATARAAAAPPSPDPANPNETDDGNGVVVEMRFARRAPEFLPSCDVSLLLEPRHRPALAHLMQLSLYDCGLQTLAGIERSDRQSEPLFPKLEQLDVGRNPKLTNSALPETFHTQFPRLCQLWLDDCGLGPDIPSTLLELNKLQVVRMTGNQLEGDLEDGIGIRYWKGLRILALDGNKLSSVGRGLGTMKLLEKLHLRGNNLTCLPEGVPCKGNSSLVMISLSSNKLSSLPLSLVDVGPSLKELYINGNQIEELPPGLAEKLVGLKKLNLAHNSIGKGVALAAGSQGNPLTSNDGDAIMEDAEDDAGIELPHDFIQRFGLPDPLTGNCIKNQCTARMEGNPLAEHMRKRYLEEEKKKASNMTMETEAVQLTA